MANGETQRWISTILLDVCVESGGGIGVGLFAWNNGYFDGTVYADGLSLATTTISASGSTYNLNNFLKSKDHVISIIHTKKLQTTK